VERVNDIGRERRAKQWTAVDQFDLFGWAAREIWYNRCMTTRSRKPLLVNLVWIAALMLLLFAGYVLSYAPIARHYMVRHGMSRSIADGTVLPVYKPVDWLIDHSSMREPLFLWARMWRMELAFSTAHSKRHLKQLPIRANES
jgi:hypothetical protein